MIHSFGVIYAYIMVPVLLLIYFTTIKELRTFYKTNQLAYLDYYRTAMHATILYCTPLLTAYLQENRHLFGYLITMGLVYSFGELSMLVIKDQEARHFTILTFFTVFILHGLVRACLVITS